MESRVTLDQLVKHVNSLGTVYEGTTNENSFFSSPSNTNEYTLLAENDTKPATSFPLYFKEIIKPYIKDIYRCGIMQGCIINNQCKNVSVVCSILTCINDNFVTLSEDQRIVYIQKFIEKVCNDLIQQNLYTEFNYQTFGVKKSELMNDLQNFSDSDIVLRFFF